MVTFPPVLFLGYSKKNQAESAKDDFIETEFLFNCNLSYWEFILEIQFFYIHFVTV